MAHCAEIMDGRGADAPATNLQRLLLCKAVAEGKLRFGFDVPLSSGLADNIIGLLAPADRETYLAKARGCLTALVNKMAKGGE